MECCCCVSWWQSFFSVNHRNFQRKTSWLPTQDCICHQQHTCHLHGYERYNSAPQWILWRYCILTFITIFPNFVNSFFASIIKIISLDARFNGRNATNLFQFTPVGSFQHSVKPEDWLGQIHSRDGRRRDRDNVVHSCWPKVTSMTSCLTQWCYFGPTTMYHIISISPPSISAVYLSQSVYRFDQHWPAV